MRKILFFIIILYLFQFCGKTSIPPNQQYVIIKFFIGTVFKKNINETEWKRLKIGERLSVDNIIKTSEKSQCDIQLSQTGIFRLKPNSEILLKNLFFDKKTGKENINLKLDKGKVFVKIKKLLKSDSSLNIETPTAVVGVRGTEFLVQADEQQNTKIAVKTGKVKVEPKVKAENIIKKEIELKDSEVTVIKKSTIEKIEKLATKTALKEKTPEITKIIESEITIQKVKTKTKKLFDEFNTMKIEKEIEQKKGRLIIETTPEDAEVVINNEIIGRTPLSKIVGIGENLKIKIEKAGFKSIEKEITIEKEETILKETLEQEIKKGSILWKFKSKTGIRGDVIAQADKIYFASIDGTIYCINNNANKIWKYKIARGVSSSPVIYKNLLLIGGNDGILYTLSKDNGKLLWKTKIGTIVYSKPLVVADRIYVGTSEGKFLALTITQGKILWQYKASSGIYSTPVKKANLLFFGCEDSNLYAIDINGKLKWKYQTGGRIVKSSPVVYKNSVFIGSYDGALYCINIDNGKLNWKYQTGNKILSTPTVSGNNVFISSTDGNLYCLNINGKLLWQKKIGKKIESSPVIKDGMVYIGSDNGKVYAINSKTGMVIWTSFVGGRIRDRVMVTAHQVYAGTDKSELSAITK